MNIPFLHPDTKNGKYQPVEHVLVSLYEHPHNTSEGSEFLDDALRMEDLLPVHTEESIAAGSPLDLL